MCNQITDGQLIRRALEHQEDTAGTGRMPNANYMFGLSCLPREAAGAHSVVADLTKHEPTEL